MISDVKSAQQVVTSCSHVLEETASGQVAWCIDCTADLVTEVTRLRTEVNRLSRWEEPDEVIDFSLTRLVRKWCPSTQDSPHEGGAWCICPRLAAATHEALGVFAQKVVKEGIAQSIFSSQWTEEEIAVTIRGMLVEEIP